MARCCIVIEDEVTGALDGAVSYSLEEPIIISIEDGRPAPGYWEELTQAERLTLSLINHLGVTNEILRDDTRLVPINDQEDDHVRTEGPHPGEARPAHRQVRRDQGEAGASQAGLSEPAQVMSDRTPWWFLVRNPDAIHLWFGPFGVHVWRDARPTFDFVPEWRAHHE